MRIVNTTGFSNDTKVYGEDGEEIDLNHVSEIRIKIEAGEFSRAEIVLQGMARDITGDELKS